MTLFILWIVAQENIPAPDSPYAWITSGGVIGLLVFANLAWLREWIVPGSRCKELQQELLDVQKFMQTEAIPLLSRVQEVLAKTLEERTWDERNRRKNRE
jgi:hypothetical protein